MAATSQTLTNNVVLTSTLQRRQKGYVDQIQKQIPLFYWLKAKGRYSPETGERLEIPVEYELDTSEASYHGFDQFDLVEQDNVTILEAHWKQYKKSIVISGLDSEVKNAGPEKVFDLLEQKEANALASLEQDMNTDFYGDGTDNDSKVVTGLDAIVPEDPTTGTLFGVNRANETWWRSQLVDQGNAGAAVAAFAEGSATTGTQTMRRGMTRLYQLCGRGKAGGKEHRYPDLILCSEPYWNAYDDMIANFGQGQRYVNKEAADAGFENLKFKGATMIADEDCPADRTNTGSGGTGIFLNSRFLKLCYSPKRNFVNRPPQTPVDQDAFVSHILWAGELTSSNSVKHGRHIGIIGLTI